jgi:hypothetical protein
MFPVPNNTRESAAVCYPSESNGNEKRDCDEKERDIARLLVEGLIGLDENDGSDCQGCSQQHSQSALEMSSVESMESNKAKVEPEEVGKGKTAASVVVAANRCYIVDAHSGMVYLLYTEPLPPFLYQYFVSLKLNHVSHLSKKKKETRSAASHKQKSGGKKNFSVLWTV